MFSNVTMEYTSKRLWRCQDLASEALRIGQSRFSFFPQETLRWFPVGALKAECLQYFGQSVSDWPDTVGTFYLLPGQHLDRCTRLVAADNLLIERFAVTHGCSPCPFIEIGL